MRFSKPKYAELPGALPLGPPPGLCPGPTGGLTALCGLPADFFISSAWEKAFLVQTEFGTQKRWFEEVLGKTPGVLILLPIWNTYNSFIYLFIYLCKYFFQNLENCTEICQLHYGESFLYKSNSVNRIACAKNMIQNSVTFSNSDIFGFFSVLLIKVNVINIY